MDRELTNGNDERKTSDEARAVHEQERKMVILLVSTINMARIQDGGRAEETFWRRSISDSADCGKFHQWLQGADDNTKYLKAMPP